MKQTFTLREFLKQQWTDELLMRPFSADYGTCREESLMLAGPLGPLPVQLSKVEHWPGTRWVKSAELWFITSLAPLARDVYTVFYGTRPGTASLQAPDLKTAVAGDHVEITTGRIGARLLLGEHSCAEPAAASEIPGPLKSMRLADGTWFGGSRMFGNKKVAAYTSRLIAGGPLFSQVEFVCFYEDGSTMRLTAGVAAGDNAISWNADVSGDAPLDGWDLLLSPGLPPLVLRLYMEFGTQREVFLSRGAEVGDSAELRLEENHHIGTGLRPSRNYPADVVTNLTPFPDWWDDFTQTTIPLQISGRDSELLIGSRDAGAWVKPASLGSQPPSQWLLKRSAPGLKEKLIPLMRGDKGEIFLRVNAAAGGRKWVVMNGYTHERREIIHHREGLSSPFKKNGEDAAARRRAKKSPRPVADARTRVEPSGPGGNVARMELAVPVIGRRLNVVKEFILDWPQDSIRAHPCLYLSGDQIEEGWKRPVDEVLLAGLRKQKEDIPDAPGWKDGDALGAYLLTGDPEIARETRVAERLRHHLGLLGHFDKWRDTPFVIELYDALIDSELVGAEEKPVFRAQMAYLAYELANPFTWSYERGYCSGNRNMTVGYMLRLGLAACAILDHPMARTWLGPCMAMMERWLDEIGPEGEHRESVANYAHVSAGPMLEFAIAAKNAGLKDYVNDPRMKKMMLFLAKQYTPPDPREIGGEAGVSRLPPSGRGYGGQRKGLEGCMARITGESDPDYSRVLQWVWRQEGFPVMMRPLGGFAYVYPDRALSDKAPDWETEYFPAYGAIFRHGFGTKNAYYANLPVHASDGYKCANGSFAVIFAKGAPISTVFVESYKDREEILVSRVLPARRRGTLEERASCYYHDEDRVLTSFVSSARQDYTALQVTINGPRRPFHVGGGTKAAALKDLSCVQMPEWPVIRTGGKPPLAWSRQILFIKDDEPGGAAYFLLRDTVGGGQPTIWQFFTLSEKIGTPAEAADAGRFLSDKPGERALEARQLKGDRFTALGQFGVDLEYYVAAPSDTPRHTLRCGESVDGFAKGVWQDLLHLQLPGDGAYYAALFPRERGEPVPAFQNLDNGKIIKLSGHFGTDYGFLCAEETAAAGEGAAFRGTAGSVQNRGKNLVLALGAEGEVIFKEFGLAADFPVSLRVGKADLNIEFPDKTFRDCLKQEEESFSGGAVSVTAPGTWKLSRPLPGVKLTQGSPLVLQVPSGLRKVTLVRV